MKQRGAYQDKREVANLHNQTSIISSVNNSEFIARQIADKCFNDTSDNLFQDAMFKKNIVYDKAQQQANANQNVEVHTW